MTKSDLTISKPIIYGRDFELKSFIEASPGISFVDAYERQVKELFVIDNNEYIGLDKDKIYKSRHFWDYRKEKSKDHVYVYYPWNKSIVKCVNKIDFYKLKTNRNQDLITSEEQKKLNNFKIAVFGMSVGSNIAFVLTQAGISNSIIIADFDELDTTNLNRIWAGVHQVGLNKTVVASRRIYEDNPFAKVTALTKGITIGVLDKLLSEKKIDCIIEEIDQMEMKMGIRKLAKKYKVPVLMVTDNGDYAVLHIERYDLGYKKIFNKDQKYWKQRMRNYKGRKDFADIVINQIIGGPHKVDPRMLRSAMKVMEKKLVSWPQLGSAALLGGVSVTVAIKGIVGKKNKKLFSRSYLYPISEK